MTDNEIKLSKGETSPYCVSAYVIVQDDGTLVLNDTGESCRVEDGKGNYVDILDDRQRSLEVKASYKGNLVRGKLTLK